jgi:carboxyl-terminal processing protease
MRSRLNLALVVAAGVSALVLTVVRQSPNSIVSLELRTPEVRAAPGSKAQPLRHDLSALKIFNMTLVRIKDRYVDPARVDPKKMLYAALDSVQLNIAEVLVEPDQARHKVKITVNDKPEIFDTDDVDSPWRLAAKLKKIFRFIEANINGGADLAKVEYAAVNGMLGTLDPHSVLMDPEQAREMNESTSGKFGGLGIVIRMIDRKLMVVKPMKDTPAFRKGIKAGDHIVRINHEPTENLTSNEAVDRMRGDPKTSVTLWIERKGETQLMRFDVMRDIIRMAQVEHKLLDRGVGYIKVKAFSKGIANDVARAMKEMSGQGATSWILDLRYNPGGLLEEAVQLSDLFVDQGTVVTTVSGRDRDARRAEHGFGDTTSPLAVLVNGGSASASEIVAGALKNLDRAVIIGSRSFGKGTVQELYDNDDKSKLKLTVAQYLTPGDRSIQNLGIVPDIALQRMYIPEKNDSADDFVRMLAPTRSYSEKDLDATIQSTYAKDNEKPAHEISFIVERKKTAPGQPNTPAPKPEDDEEEPDADEIVEDFEMRFAKELVSTVSGNRLKLVAGSTKLVTRVRGEEEKKLVAALGTIGIDWAGADKPETGASLDVSIATLPKGKVKAGEIVSVIATVKNTGTAAAYRVLPRIHTDDNVFDDTELPIGKVAPGETKTFTAKVKVPKDAFDRVDRLGLEVKELRNAPARIVPAELHIEAAPRPVFAYAYQLVDDGNGDGLVQRGEKYRLQLQIKNTGVGATQDAQVLLRNATGDGVTLGKSRLELKDTLGPGQVKEIEFPIATDATLKSGELIVELMAYDAALDVQSSEKLKFKVQGSVSGQRGTGDVTVRNQVTIRSGAHEESSVVGTATKGQSFPTLGTFGGFTKVKLGTKVGFVPTSMVSSGGAGNGNFIPLWNSTPPVIAMNMKGLETSNETYKLTGSVNDEQKVEDLYIFVSNRTAKIESRKVFYRSNRGAKDLKSMNFAADLPLWPGSNMVTVIARSNSEVKSIKQMFVYRDPPRTAQKTP